MEELYHLIVDLQTNMYIGNKKIKSSEVSNEKTIAGNSIMKVIYEDESIEFLSSLMFDKVASKDKCDLSELRDKRVLPVVEMTLALLREWGINTGELQYFSALLNKSLDFNTSQAYIKLISKYMPKPISLDDVDFITIDRVLREKNE